MADIAVSKQLAVGKVTVVPFPTYNLMAWSGTDGAHSLNLGTAAPGADFPSASTGQPGNGQAGLNGPAVAVLPDGGAAYIAWVGSSGQVCVTRATAGGGTVPTWSIGTVWSIGGSNAKSAPTAALGTQNGHLVLNLIWQDGGASSMVLAQLLVGREAETLAFCSLGRSCIDAPSLTCGPGGSYLAWCSGTGSNGTYTLNLAHDPRGGVNFDFGGTLALMDLPRPASMVYLPLGPRNGYAVHTDGDGVHAAHVGCNQSGDWVVNTAPGTIATITGQPPAGPANARLGRRVDGGVSQGVVEVVWPGTYGNAPPNSILFSSVPVVVAPIPVVQCALA